MEIKLSKVPLAKIRSDEILISGKKGTEHIQFLKTVLGMQWFAIEI